MRNKAQKMVLGHEETEELNQEDVIKTISTLQDEDGTPHIRTHDKNGRRISNIPDLVE